MLIAPDGTTSSFIFPPYNVGYFAETTGFNVYLGMQANTASAINQSVVYSSFAVSNVPSACNDNFLADTSLNTNLWISSYSSGPKGVLIVPSNAPYWVAWTLPAPGFSLVDIGSLGTGAFWNEVTNYAPIPMFDINQQLVSANDLPPGNAAFFAVSQSVLSRLQILLPGETAAPGTPTGKTGTPDIQYAGNYFYVTVNAVDDRWNLVSSVNDTIAITSTDTNTTDMPPNAALVGGTGQFVIVFSYSGNYTMTASDVTDPAIAPDTSASVECD
jgi:hypothetical protein